MGSTGGIYVNPGADDNVFEGNSSHGNTDDGILVENATTALEKNVVSYERRRRHRLQLG